VPDLTGQVALVTGASRGVGHGVALGLARAGVRVFATGRTIEKSTFDAEVIRLVCDHTDDAAVEQVFRQIDQAAGRIDILVTAAWGGYERMVEDGRFTWTAPFWEQPSWRWNAMMDAGVRAAYLASQHAARRMVAAGRGLVVHVSFWPAQKYSGNVLYGMAKAATDKMAADMAVELRRFGVTAVSLYPGLVRTEAVLAAGVFDLSSSESPEFIGRAVAALAGDRAVARHSGRVLVAATLGELYGFTDIDGRRPRPLTVDDA
jgi:dehydrogenase/reductase SDR family member 1